jgi:hypothetical protein
LIALDMVSFSFSFFLSFFFISVRNSSD